MKNEKIVIWMNIPSVHQNDLINELSTLGYEITVVYAHREDAQRRQQGWFFDDSSVKYQTIFLNEKLTYGQLPIFIFLQRHSIHIVTGIWAEMMCFSALCLLNLFRAQFLIYTESPIPDKQRNAFKRIVLSVVLYPMATLLIKNACGYLAVGESGADFLVSLGVKKSKIYRFGYFRNIDKLNSKEPSSSMSQLYYIGQLIPRKGIDILIEAIVGLIKTHQNFRLIMVGYGHQQAEITHKIVEYQLHEFIKIQAPIAINLMPKTLIKADLLLLPARFDGWGMVVNEALLCGIPVLVSSQCGAKELIYENDNGFHCKASSVESLVEKLTTFLNLSSQEKTHLKQQAHLTHERISVKVVAPYLSACIQHSILQHIPKPTAPWLR
jgi:glycosyltransferase involved in cell wall biosynthesis